VLDFHADPMPPSPGEDELRALLERARLGEAAAVPALRAALDQHPEVWGQFGNLADHSKRSWIELISGPDLALAEVLTRKTADLEAELAGPDPTPLEKLLAARITANWLQLHHAEAAQAQSAEVSLKHAEFTSKRQARVHKSYLMAIASLATIRRLLPADTSKRLPTSPGDHDLAAVAKDEHSSGSVDAIPETEVEDRLKDLARPGPLALFDRPGPGSKQGDKLKLLFGDQGLSAS
jgi:hypothetical protein